MMDRESKREKIISDKMREVKLKIRTAEQKKDVLEETPSEIEERIAEENVKVVETAEEDFFKKIEDMERKRRIQYLGGLIFFFKLNSYEKLQQKNFRTRRRQCL